MRFRNPRGRVRGRKGGRKAKDWQASGTGDEEGGKRAAGRVGVGIYVNECEGWQRYEAKAKQAVSKAPEKAARGDVWVAHASRRCNLFPKFGQSGKIGAVGGRFPSRPVASRPNNARDSSGGAWTTDLVGSCLRQAADGKDILREIAQPSDFPLSTPLRPIQIIDARLIKPWERSDACLICSPGSGWLRPAPRMHLFAPTDGHATTSNILQIPVNLSS